MDRMLSKWPGLDQEGVHCRYGRERDLRETRVVGGWQKKRRWVRSRDIGNRLQVYRSISLDWVRTESTALLHLSSSHPNELYEEKGRVRVREISGEGRCQDLSRTCRTCSANLEFAVAI